MRGFVLFSARGPCGGSPCAPGIPGYLTVALLSFLGFNAIIALSFAIVILLRKAFKEPKISPMILLAGLLLAVVLVLIIIFFIHWLSLLIDFTNNMYSPVS